MTIPLSIYAYILIVLVFVAYLDFKYRKISNLCTILNIVSSISIFFLFPDHRFLILKSFYLPITIFIIGVILFKYRIMGGGDSKFLATLLLLIPSPTTTKFLVFFIFYYCGFCITSDLLFNSKK